MKCVLVMLIIMSSNSIQSKPVVSYKDKSIDDGIEKLQSIFTQHIDASSSAPDSLYRDVAYQNVTNQLVFAYNNELFKQDNNTTVTQTEFASSYHKELEDMMTLQSTQALTTMPSDIKSAYEKFIPSSLYEKFVANWTLRKLKVQDAPAYKQLAKRADFDEDIEVVPLNKTTEIRSYLRRANRKYVLEAALSDLRFLDDEFKKWFLPKVKHELDVPLAPLK